MLTQRKALVLVTLVLLCFALLSSRWTGMFTRPLTNVVMLVQHPAGWIASQIGFDPAVDYPEMSEQQLEDQLAAERKWNDELWQQNEQLREQIEAFNAIIEIRPIESIRMVEARVSRFNDDPLNPTLTLLRGSLSGIKPDTAVAYRSNLIGFVTDQIGPTNATVSLITKPGFQIEVNIMPPEGVRAGQGWPVKDRVKSDGKGGFTCSLSKETAGYLQPGDLVRVSDTLRESANGFLLGVINKIEPDSQSPHLLSQIFIKPRTPIGPQRLVTVLTERDD